MKERRCALCQRSCHGPDEATTLFPAPFTSDPRTRRNFTRGQRLTVVLLCRACHKKIHSLFTASELARTYCSIEALAAHPEIARFIDRVARRPSTVDVRVRRRRR